MLVPGHTPGHGAVAITSGGEKFVYVTDIVHHAGIQLPHPDWHIAYDTDPVLAAKSRRALLTKIAVSKRDPATVARRFSRFVAGFGRRSGE